jgi:2-polyprenyl-3-methyl-5-hydroxy-6-metoxy-1,4-benzoquinol methylase
MKLDLIEELYAEKEMYYFSLERTLFKNAVKQNDLNILDVGCGTGILGAYFIKNQNCKVYGIEISKSAYEEALEVLNYAVKGNVETMVLDYDKNLFDVIIMGDVVEHLINPMDTLKKLLPFLKKGGQIHVTVPNVRHWEVVVNLLFKDEWEYKDSGILDYTHIRFFTKKSFVKMLNRIANVHVVKTERVIQKLSKSDVINKFTIGLFSGFLASHTFVTIEKR